MNREEFEIHEQDFRFYRTTCGLIGFILFFVGSFLSFIISGELDNHSELAFILGGISLLLTVVFFFCVLNESKKIIILPILPEGMEMAPLISQQPNASPPEPELPIEQQPEPDLEPYWDDKTRHDFGYVRGILGMPPGDSDETAESENDPDSDMAALKQMVKPGSSTDNESVNPTYESITPTDDKINPTYDKINPTYDKINPTYDKINPTYDKINPTYDKINPTYDKINPTYDKINPTYDKINPTYESMPGTSQGSEGTISSIGGESTDIIIHPQNTRTSIADDENPEIIESRPDISPSRGQFHFSPSDSTKSSSASLEKQTESGLAKRQTSTDSEVESKKLHVVTSEDAKSVKFSKSE